MLFINVLPITNYLFSILYLKKYKVFFLIYPNQIKSQYMRQVLFNILRNSALILLSPVSLNYSDQRVSFPSCDINFGFQQLSFQSRVGAIKVRIRVNVAEIKGCRCRRGVARSSQLSAIRQITGYRTWRSLLLLITDRIVYPPATTFGQEGQQQGWFISILTLNNSTLK